MQCVDMTPIGDGIREGRAKIVFRDASWERARYTNDRGPKVPIDAYMSSMH